MAILDILHFPDPRLRTRAQPVDVVDDGIRQLVDDMFETMYQAPGIGLAATQVNVHKRVIVVDVSREQDRPLVFINPQLIEKEGIEEMDEGCLSVPGIYETVKRAERIKVRALNRDGETFEMEADDLLAVKPTILISVPRIFERVYSKIRCKLDEGPAPARLLFEKAENIGWRRFLHQQKRGAWSPAFLLWPLFEKLVARKIKDKLGGRLRFAVCGGAALTNGVARLFIGLDIPIIQGRGHAGM